MSMRPKLFRVILPVTDIDHAATFYGALLDMVGRRVSPGRHYFDCDGTILACYDPRADGDGHDASANPDHLYFSVTDLEGAYNRACRLEMGWLEDSIKTRPWGERSFYARDPFGNKICFVDERTAFRGDA